MLSTWRELDDGSILISSRSAPEEFCPPVREGFVRGFMVVSGYWIQPLTTVDQRSADTTSPTTTPPSSTTSSSTVRSTKSAPRCRMTMIAHSELGGTLPAAMINAFLSTAVPKHLTAVHEVMQKENRRKR